MRSPAVLASNGGNQLSFCLVVSNAHAPHEAEVPTSGLIDLVLARLVSMDN